MFRHTHIVKAQSKPGNTTNDPNNMANTDAQKIAALVLQMIERLPKGQDNPSRGMQNEIIGDAGLAYNTKSRTNGGQIVGGL